MQNPVHYLQGKQRLEMAALRKDFLKMTPVGFEPTPLRTGAWSQRLRPLGQTVFKHVVSLVVYRGVVELPHRASCSGGLGMRRSQYHRVKRADSQTAGMACQLWAPSSPQVG